MKSLRQQIIMESFDIQAYTYEQRHNLLPILTAAFANCGGWILDRRNLSATNIEFQVELQMCSILDLYAAIVSTGVELTRTGHDAFTELCTRRKHMPVSADLGQIVGLRLEIAFLDEVTLRSQLIASASVA